MTTRLYGIIGHPVGQVRSPAVFNARFAQAGIDAAMVPFDIPPASFAESLKALRNVANIAGLIITVPHKIAAAALAISASPRVAIVGAANALRPVAGGWEAEIFDGVGFVAGLVAHGHSPRGLPSCVVGAGGAGLAIAEALLASGARVTIGDVVAERAHKAATRLAKAYGDAIAIGVPDPAHQLVVNATPVGMGDDLSLPFDLAALDRQALVADAIMKPPITPLLAQAHAAGLPILEGRHMLDGQVEPIWEYLGMGVS